MLKALRDVKPTISRKQDWQKHMKTHERLRQNLSLYRKVGKSQPRPRIQMSSEDGEKDQRN